MCARGAPTSRLAPVGKGAFKRDFFASPWSCDYTIPFLRTGCIHGLRPPPDQIYPTMGERCGAVALLVALASCHLAGLASFGRGFFLTRLELRRTSRAGDLATSFLSASSAGHPTPRGDDNTPLHAWAHGQPPFTRAVLVVIDAWRFDFARWASLPDECGPRPMPDPAPPGLPPRCYYENRMPQLAGMLERHASAARLYRAVADAPTVTLQRLKGLTSGSLPTFIDAAANFDAPAPGSGTAGGLGSFAIGEDTIIGQVSAREWGWGTHASDAGRARPSGPSRRSLAFLGDDTWTGLFEGAFNVSHPFPSFNVADLHTVDDGIDARIGGVIEAGGWALVVAHYLGVDHVGHTHGPAHPAMAAKLAQMDASLQAILRSVASSDARSRGIDRSVVVVLGDHGMTAGGNHGGASDEEAHAGMVLVEPAGVFACDAATGACTERGARDLLDRKGSSMFTAPAPSTATGAHAADSVAAGDYDVFDVTAGTCTPSELTASDVICQYAAAEEDSGARSHPEGSHAPLGEPRTVSQIDIVPTLSLLLGLPIPFASLGRVIPDVRFDRPVTPAAASGSAPSSDSDSHQVTAQLRRLRQRLTATHALAVNAWQVHRYLHAYNGAAAAAATATVGSASAEAAVDAANLWPVSFPPPHAEIESVFPHQQLTDLRRDYLRGMKRYKALLCAVTRALREAGHPSPLVDSHTHLRAGHAPSGSEAVSAYASAMSAVDAALWQAAHGSSAMPGGAGLLLRLSSVVYAIDGPASSLSPDCELSAFLSQASSMCRSLWTRFDVPAMVWGLAAMVASTGAILSAVLASWMFPQDAPLPSLEVAKAAARRSILAGFGIALCVNPQRALASILATSEALCGGASGLAGDAPGLCSSISVTREAVLSWAPPSTGGRASFLIASLAAGLRLGPPLPVCAAVIAALSAVGDIATHWRNQPHSATRAPSAPAAARPLSILAVVILVLRLWALTTNSFIVAEARVVGLLQATGTLVAGVWAAAQTRASGTRVSRLATATAIALVCGRLVEQALGPLAFPISFGDPMAPATAEAAAAAAAARADLPRLEWPSIIALAFLPVTIAAASIAEVEGGKLSAANFASLVGCGIGLAGCLAHWSLQQLYSSHAIALAARLHLPRGVYLLLLSQMAVTLALGCASTAHDLTLRLNAAAIPALALVLGPRSPPVLLALAMHLSALRTVTMELLAESARAPDHCPATVTALPGGRFSASLLRCVLRTPALLLTVLWGLLPWHYYLSMGHGNVFSSLDFAAPFTGWDDFSRVRSGALLLANTCAPHILALGIGTIPLLAPGYPSLAGPRRPSVPLFTAAGNPALIVALPAAVTLVTSAFCLFARRHLMVWAVFAPKWMFDAGAFVATVGCALVATTVAAGTSGSHPQPFASATSRSLALNSKAKAG